MHKRRKTGPQRRLDGWQHFPWINRATAVSGWPLARRPGTRCDKSHREIQAASNSACKAIAKITFGREQQVCYA